eukprot:4948600-Pleurochrysis_carterae.AAC.1
MERSERGRVAHTARLRRDGQGGSESPVGWVVSGTCAARGLGDFRKRVRPDRSMQQVESNCCTSSKLETRGNGSGSGGWAMATSAANGCSGWQQERGAGGIGRTSPAR